MWEDVAWEEESDSTEKLWLPSYFLFYPTLRKLHVSHPHSTPPILDLRVTIASIIALTIDDQPYCDMLEMETYAGTVR